MIKPTTHIAIVAMPINNHIIIAALITEAAFAIYRCYTNYNIRTLTTTAAATCIAMTDN